MALYMNTITAVSQYGSYKLWIDDFRSNSTKRAYSVHVSVFCKFHYVNLDELVKIKSDELKRMIINYILELKKRVKISQVSQKEARPQFGV